MMPVMVQTVALKVSIILMTARVAKNKVMRETLMGTMNTRSRREVPRFAASKWHFAYQV